jgi:hypothetical protein
VRASPTSDYYNARGSLLLIHKHHRARLPFAMAYWTVRCLLPQLLRGRWRRLATLARALRDVNRLASSEMDDSRETPLAVGVQGKLGGLSKVSR